jgi:uncharacterized protein YqeY
VAFLLLELKTRMEPMSDSLIDQLKAELRVAMKTRDQLRITTLRTMLSALDNATAVEVDPTIVPLQGITPDVPRRELSRHDEIEILRREAEGRRTALQQYESLGKMDVATRLRAELAIFDPYLDREARWRVAK